MSDFTTEQYETAIARDRNLRLLQLAMRVRTELRDSAAIQAILDSFKSDAERALKEFAYTDPSNLKSILDLQVRVRAFIATWDALGHVLQAGNVAEMAVNEEEAVDTDE